ncbi:MAG: hypothetical protein K0R33_2875 [Mycobacterium sp.]|nr:hypothetical protein [Mycobacterium sp.]
MVRSGRTVIPGVSMSMKNAVMPAWGERSDGESEEPSPVRVSRMQRCENCAKLVHTFWPLMTHWSPFCTALVVSEARSLPDPGSENP